MKKIIFLFILVLFCNCGPVIKNPIISSQEQKVTFTKIFRSTQDTTISTVNPLKTLLPTLPAKDTEVKLLEMLSNNGGCSLPCFWGLTPGQTSEETTLSILHGFNEISPSVEIIIPRDDLNLATSVVWGNEDTPQSDIIRWITVDMKAYRRVILEEGYMDLNAYDTSYYAEYFQYYTLPKLFSTYGQPFQAYVFLDTGIAEMGLGIDLYLLYLDYTESGWIAMLTMPLIRKENFLIGCPAQAFTKLWLWSPSDVATAREYGFADGTDLKSVEEATSYTMEEFYQQFKVPANTKCFETPIDIYEH